MGIGLALYGAQGHQLQGQAPGNDRVRVVALGAFPANQIPKTLSGARRYETLDALLQDEEVQLVSFCSPFKDEQGEHIIRCLEAGKHAYAEKPCCMEEAVLDRIIDAARQNGRVFHEMGGTAFQQPYTTLRDLVASGAIGEVIQVFSQKSYPWASWRPADERIDGGLAMQAGVYNARFAEHVAGMKINSMELRQTRLGNPDPESECRRAVSFLMTFENGGVGSAVANYCCPASPGWANWGYETLRIFGENGFVESIDRGRIGILALNDQEPQVLNFEGGGQDWFEWVLDEIETGRKRIPLSLEEELSPTRWVIRARQRCNSL